MELLVAIYFLNSILRKLFSNQKCLKYFPFVNSYISDKLEHINQKLNCGWNQVQTVKR